MACRSVLIQSYVSKEEYPELLRLRQQMPWDEDEGVNWRYLIEVFISSHALSKSRCMVESMQAKRVFRFLPTSLYSQVKVASAEF